MKIENSKYYQVNKMHCSDPSKDCNYGVISGEELKAIVKGYKWDDDYDMFFSEKGMIGIMVKEKINFNIH
jgi:hypothetical protein